MKRFYKWILDILHIPYHELTPKGIYFCYYLIQKYINENSKDDYNEEYEKMVDKALERIEKRKFFSSFKDEFGNEVEIDEFDKRAFAATTTIILMLYGISKKDCEKIYNYIEDKDAIVFIKEGVKRRLFF